MIEVMQKLFWANGIIKKLSRVQKQLPATTPRQRRDSDFEVRHC